MYVYTYISHIYIYICICMRVPHVSVHIHVHMYIQIYMTFIIDSNCHIQSDNWIYDRCTHGRQGDLPWNHGRREDDCFCSQTPVPCNNLLGCSAAHRQDKQIYLAYIYMYVYMWHISQHIHMHVCIHIYIAGLLCRA